MPTHKLASVLRGQTLGAFRGACFFISCGVGKWAPLSACTEGDGLCVFVCKQNASSVWSPESSNRADLGLWYGPLGALILDAGSSLKITRI